MVDTYNMEQSIETIEEAASSLRDELESFSDAAGYWSAVEDEGYSDSDEVIEALQQGAAWVEFADASGIDPKEAESLVSCKDELEAMVHVFSVAAGRCIDDHEDAQTALEIIRGEGKESLSGVTAALKLLIEALQDAEILPRTVIVPAPVNDVEAVNPPFSNGPSTATVVQAADETNNNATT